MSVICLVVPPSRFLLDERAFPSLGSLTVAAALEAEGHDVEVLDLSGLADPMAVLRAHAASSEASMFAVGATTPQMPAADEIRRTLRDIRPDARLVLGGPHASLLRASSRLGSPRSSAIYASLEPEWDHVIAGDGARAMVALASGEVSERTIDADGPEHPLWMKPGDSSPWPARRFVDLETYRYSIDGRRATSVISQLGCPFGCNFCSGRSSPSYRRLRSRPVSSVLAEIEHLHREHGYEGIMFFDDELNVTRRMIVLMEELADLQSRIGADFRLRGFIRSELFTREQAEAMRRAGFRWILAGFESGSDLILSNIDKGATVADNDRCMDVAREAGLKVKALMSIGHAGETEETCRETERWLLSRRPDDFDVTIVSAYPGSAYFDSAFPEGSPGHLNPRQDRGSRSVCTFVHPRTGARLHSFDVDHRIECDFYKGDPSDGHLPFVFTDELTNSDLTKLRFAIEETVRSELHLPWNPAGERRTIDVSGISLPPTVLRGSFVG